MSRKPTIQKRDGALFPPISPCSRISLLDAFYRNHSMPFLEDMHLPRPDPKPTVINEKRAIDFRGRYFKTHANNRAENPLLPPELFLRYFVWLKLIQSLLKLRTRLSAAPRYVVWGHLASEQLSDICFKCQWGCRGWDVSCLLLQYQISRATSTPIPKKIDQIQRDWLAWMLAKAICQLCRRWNGVVGKISREFKPIYWFVLAEFYYCPEVVGVGTTRVHEWLIPLLLEISLTVQKNKVHTEQLGGEE